MSSVKLNGRQLAKQINLKLKEKITHLKIRPGLAIIMIGQNSASQSYIHIKEKTCQQLGIHSQKHLFTGRVKQSIIIDLIKRLNRQSKINGIIVQLPLPKRFNTNKIIQTIDPQKDVDGFVVGSPFVSPTIQGVLCLLKTTGQKLVGKSALILTNSQIFAQPLAKQLINKLKIKPTVHLSRQSHLTKKVESANILITALGHPSFIQPAMIKPGIILIDVGYSRINNKSVGDIDPACYQKSSAYSPVPGGVGPLTVAYLLKNTVLAKIR